MDINTPPTTPAPTTEDKTVAILSYLTLIGFIVAIVMHSSKKTKLGAFHLRQALGLILTSIAAWICVIITVVVLSFLLALIKPLLFLVPILAMLIWLAFAASLIALWVMGFIAAINGQMKPMPLVGELYQKWFGTAFD